MGITKEYSFNLPKGHPEASGPNSKPGTRNVKQRKHLFFKRQALNVLADLGSCAGWIVLQYPLGDDGAVPAVVDKVATVEDQIQVSYLQADRAEPVHEPALDEKGILSIQMGR